MSGAICSVVAPEGLGAALALNASIARFAAVEHVVLVTCSAAQGAELRHRCPPGLRLVFVDGLCAARGMGAQLFDAYGARADGDAFRRALKPVLMAQVLEGVERVIYVEADLCFFRSPEFLFDELATCPVFLSPHWRCWEPGADAAGFEAMYSEGFFNGGLVGANRDGRPALEWWAGACLYSCDRNKQAGRYAEQRYLDLVALEFGGVRVLRHKGCGVAAWNRWACPASLDAGGGVLIDGRWPLVCAQFTGAPADAVLRPCFEDYLALLAPHAPELAARLRASREQ